MKGIVSIRCKSKIQIYRFVDATKTTKMRLESSLIIISKKFFFDCKENFSNPLTVRILLQ